MTPEKQRIEIAKACGWIYVGYRSGMTAEDGYSGRPPESLRAKYHVRHPDFVMSDFSDGPPARPIAHIPDYLNDLDAMHEAEKILTAIQCNDYDTYIMHRLREGEINPPANRFKFHATAGQRAEAFLKTIGKWEEES